MSLEHGDFLKTYLFPVASFQEQQYSSAISELAPESLVLAAGVAAVRAADPGVLLPETLLASMCSSSAAPLAAAMSAL